MAGTVPSTDPKKKLNECTNKKTVERLLNPEVVKQHHK